MAPLAVGWALALAACGASTGPGTTPTAAATEPEPASPAGPEALGEVALTGPLYEPSDLSGGALVDGRLFLVSDEGGALMRLRADGEGWTHDQSWLLPELTPTQDIRADDHRPELDLEALAPAPGGLLVVGSHSRKRKRVKADKTVAENLDRLTENLPEEGRRFLAHVALDAAGDPTALTPWTLFPALQAHPVIGPATGLPSKENGLDLEGAAVLDDVLLVGARGPVLRDGWVPLFALPLDGAGALGETRYLPLAGLGVRDLLATAAGVVVLSGPVGDGPGAYALHLWDGRDCLAGKDAPGCGLVALGALPERSGKPEGLVLEAEEPGGLLLLVLLDGVSRHAERFRVPLP